MTMNLKQFKENLLAYGADVQKWPEDMRQAGLKAMETSSELRTLLAEEKRLEQVLRARKYEEPSRDLAQRIVSASLSKKRSPRRGLRGFFSELFWEFSIPRPALTAISISVILVLILGFAIGFLNPIGAVSTEQTQTNLQEFLYYEGEVL
jgi:hypothetical protein